MTATSFCPRLSFARVSVAVLVFFGTLSAPPLPSAAAAPAVRATSPELIAAFLINFVRFTQWPEGRMADGAPFVACVIGADAVAASLEGLAKDQRIGGRAIQIRRVSANAANRCHIVYGGGLDQKDLQQLIRLSAAEPVLTVTDADDFAARGGIVNFFLEDGKMRFAVNAQAADRAELRISSRLLSLSRIVSK